MDLSDIFGQVGAWGWVIGGLLLLGLEVLLPGTFFLWFGISAIVVGAIAVIFDLAWEVQLVVFVVLALVLVFFGRRYFASRTAREPDVVLNQRAEQLLGTIYVLSHPIVDGVGRVKVGDSTWRVAWPDCPAGTTVRIIAVDGAVLHVEPAKG